MPVRITGKNAPRARATAAMRADSHDENVSLAFTADATGTITGSTNVLEIMTVTAAMLFGWAPKTDKTKYNNMRVLNVAAESSATASISVSGTHAVWGIFDQQEFLTPLLVGDAAIAAAIATMRNTGNSAITHPMRSLRRKFAIPDGLRNFEFQDTAAQAGGQAYDPTRIMKLVVIYPKGNRPNIFLRASVRFAGKGPIISAAPATIVPVFDHKYLSSSIPALESFIADAITELGVLTPYKDEYNPVIWIKTLAVAVDRRNVTYRIKQVSDLDGLPIGDFWFPKLTASGSILSSLRPLCDHVVTDARIADGETFYAPTTYYDDRANTNRALAPSHARIVDEVNLSVEDRTAREMLSVVLDETAIRTRPGSRPEGGAANNSEE